MQKCLLALLILSPSLAFRNLHGLDLFVVWSVGQGQFTSLITHSHCIHLDFGGEIFPARQLRQFCAEKQNTFLFTHFDDDHINFLEKLPLTRIKSFCLLLLPHQKPNKHKVLKLPQCDSSVEATVKMIKPLSPKPSSHTSNAQSTGFVIKNCILITGDAPKTSELHWVKEYKNEIKQVSILVAGHHGSRSSSSLSLLKTLKIASQIFISSRASRYGHPHPETIRSFTNTGHSYLSTELWGHIAIEVDKACIPFQDLLPQAHNKRSRRKH